MKIKENGFVVSNRKLVLELVGKADITESKQFLLLLPSPTLEGLIPEYAAPFYSEDSFAQLCESYLHDPHWQEGEPRFQGHLYHVQVRGSTIQILNHKEVK